jgi:hypothetical protein
VGRGSDDVAAEALHLTVLGRELKQHQIDAGLLVGPDPGGDLLGGAHQARPQTAVGDAVLLQGDLRLQLRALHEVLVGGVGLGGGADVQDAAQLLLGLLLGVAADHVAGDAEGQRRQPQGGAPRAHVGDLRGDGLGRVAVHDVGVAPGGDQVLGGGGLPAHVDGGPAARLGLQDRALQVVEVAVVGHRVLGEQPADHLQPLGGTGVAGVVHVEGHAVLRGLVLPPGRDDVEAQPSGRDGVQGGQGFGGQRGVVVVGADRQHQFQPLGDGGDRRGQGPGVDAGRAVALDVVEVELGDQGEVEAVPLAVDGQVAQVRPVDRHLLVGDVAQPAAEDRHPVSVAHQRVSSSSISRFRRRATCRGPERGATASTSGL